MNKTYLKQFSVLFVLISGLFSCSKERAGDASDNFGIDRPVIYTQYNSKAGPSEAKRFESKNTEAIYPLSVIEVSSLKGHNFNEDPINLNVVSLCQVHGASRSYQKSFSNIESLEVLNIIDPSVLVEVSRIQENISCSFHFEFSNKIESTEDFQFNDILIAPLSRDEVSEINLISRDEHGAQLDSRQPIVAENRDPQMRYPLISQTIFKYESPEENALLVCENYVSQLNSKSRSEISLSQFESAKILWHKSLPPEVSGVDPRLAFPAQDCRIVVETGSPKLKLKVSRQFRLVYKSPDLKLSFTSNSSLFTSLNKDRKLLAGSSPELFHLTLFNPSNIPITFALGNIQAQVRASRDRPSTNYHEGYNQELVMQIDGGHSLSQDPRLGKIMTIEANSHVIVSYQLSFPTNCKFTPESAPIEVQQASYHELLARILSNLTVIQIANPVVGANTYQSEFYKVYEQTDTGTLPRAFWATETATSVLCDHLPIL